MKLTAPRESFVTALGHAGRAVSSRSTLPSLGGVLFNASSDGLAPAGDRYGDGDLADAE